MKESGEFAPPSLISSLLVYLFTVSSQVSPAVDYTVNYT